MKKLIALRVEQAEWDRWLLAAVTAKLKGGRSELVRNAANRAAAELVEAGRVSDSCEAPKNAPN